MPPLAVSLPRLFGREVLPSECVLSGRNRLKVLWVYALPGPAQMVELQPTGYLPDKANVRKPMSIPIYAV